MRPTPKRLVVNADDLGYDPEIDRGIFEAHARGMVTSATAMVDTPFAPAALRAAPGSLALGLHAVMDPARAGGSGAGAPDRALRRAARRAADAPRQPQAPPCAARAAGGLRGGGRGARPAGARARCSDAGPAARPRSAHDRPLSRRRRPATLLDAGAARFGGGGPGGRHHRADVPPRVRAVPRPHLLRRGARSGAP